MLMQGDMWSFLFFVLLFIFGPKLYMWQMMYKLETDLKKLEGYSKKAEAILLKRVSEKPTKEMKKRLEHFMDFFISEPVNLDPAGIINKLDHVINESERKFEEFALELDPKMKKNDLPNVMMGMKGALGTVQIFKIVRHFILMSKKTNNLQFAMILQMQLPMLMKIAKAQVQATRALANGIPIGDTIGPLVAASFKTKEGTEIVKDVVVSEEKIEGRKVFVMKSKGPESRLGQQGEAVKQVIAKHKIDYIIAIDAAAKMEGEKTGTVAEGVGVPMGGVGVQRFKIEESITDKKVIVDALIIKQGFIEASIPMKKEIYDALEPTRDKIKHYLKKAKKKNVLIVGVGNTAGAGNTNAAVKASAELLKNDWAKYAKKKKDEAEKTKKWWKS
ncbi:MAG: DUF1512 domain-containing protein [Nanohaloarchaea archaeon]|nr:DUF1512 domain-containing protein [Candidatus Nanohaloarchaea archaeon]